MDSNADSKSHSDYPIRADRKKAAIDKVETENPEDRVGQELPADVASNDRVSGTAVHFDPGNGDGKPDAVPDSNGSSNGGSKESGNVRINDDSKNAEQMYKVSGCLIRIFLKNHSAKTQVLRRN